MKKLLVFFFSFTLLCQPHTYCQVLHLDSTRFIEGNHCCEQIWGAIPTADKGIFFVGNEATHPGGIIPYIPYGGQNLLIGKIDSARQISWIKVYGGNGDDGALTACQTPDGGYAVLGSTASNDGDVTGYKGNGDIWLLRLDSSGNLIWENTYGSSNQDGPLSIANTPDHGFIILGATHGSDGDVPFHYAGGYWDWVLIKTDSLGNKQWSKDMGGTGEESEDWTTLSGSILSIDNNYYLVSGSSSTDHDCTDTMWHSGDTLWNAGYSAGDYYVIKLDSSGNRLWDSSYGGSGSDDVSHAIFDTRDSSIVICGFTGSNDYMVTDFDGANWPGEVWVIKVNKNGKLLWQKTLGGPQDEFGAGICAGPNGGYIACGIVFPGPIGSGDYWLFVLDSNGNEISNKVFGGILQEQWYFSILPYLNGYAAAGFSLSTSFTEGSTYGATSVGENGFISYFDTATHTEVKNIFPSNTLKLYPNPATTELSIISTDRITSVGITNLLGQSVYSESVQHASQVRVDVADLPAGMYFIRINGTEVRKFVKE